MLIRLVNHASSVPKSVVQSRVLMPQRVRLSTWIERDLWIQVTTASVDRNITKEQIVDEALRAWLDERTDAARRG